ncbi:ABC transporter ATP-binding protein [Schumannella soli]|uniref:ABC transporter ATP-binding protein n=1 Tax=Schumannella soli TaxID=2590779 RepID=A0A506Y8H9_9MICO|nr:ABC transporter ATP-binding protein [Schumannella soli]
MPLEVRGLRIRHEDRPRWTPDGVDLEVRLGEVVLLLGPSGSGKSTLASALNGLTPQSIPADMQGTVRVAGIGTDHESVGRLSAHVAMVFQDPDAQIVTGTVLDEVCFGPENLLVPAEEVLERAEAALRRVGLWERRDENPDRLSGGGRQRLAIAAALALRAPLIVLDEPTANLDPAGIDEVYAALAELVATGDHALVLIEHNLDAAMQLVDRVLVLDGLGRVAASGPAREVLTERAEELHDLGVWLPESTLAALRLRAAGIHLDPLPLTPADLTRALDAIELPEPRTRVAERERESISAAAEGRANGTAADTVAPPASDLALDVRGLALSRGGVPVLHDVDLALGRGRFLALVGENGAGKTSLLQAIAGVIRAPKGRIRVAGLDPATTDARRLADRIGFVFQNPEHQFIRGTVADELAHGLELRRVDPDEIATRVEAMLARVDLGELRDVHPFLLSGGQKRRLSVGTALITGAEVLALDEPTFGQDRARAAELLDILDDLVAGGTTVIAVTHDLQLVADHASDTAVLAGGRVLAAGETGRILAGDELERAGLRRPPLATALGGLTRHPAWRGLTRMADLP